LAQALHYCHCGAMEDTRVLHRDIKPNNIGFLGSGRLVLFDFGLAKTWAVATDDLETRQLTGQTGSLRYMAPEVALNQPYNHKAEVFSFASVLWQMCAHEIPFQDLQVPAFMERVAKGDERPKVKDSWPAPLKQLLTRCWRAEHAERPEFSEIVTVLAGLLASEDGP